MSVPHPGGDLNANFYAQLKRDVFDRVPQITAIESILDDIEAKSSEQYSIRTVLPHRQDRSHRN
ncbi:hypothetical protein GCM10009000_118100 [Halobacterium noricense]